MAVALIVAAGRGERLGAPAPKALAALAGRTLLERSVDSMLACQAIVRIVVALPPGVQLAEALARVGDSGGGDGAATGLPGTDVSADAPVAVPDSVIGVEGGAVRSASVASALAAAGPCGEDEPIVVHDAARPLATPELVQRTLDALAGDPALDGAIAAAPVSDTVKRARGGIVVETLDRAGLWAVQTPQAFRFAALRRALDVSPEILARATDDAWLVERAGGRVAIVPSERENLKVTTPLDLAVAELLIARGHV